MLGEGAYGFVCSAEMLETGTQVIETTPLTDIKKVSS